VSLVDDIRSEVTAMRDVVASARSTIAGPADHAGRPDPTD
jgi:hypothetical protein